MNINWFNLLSIFFLIFFFFEVSVGCVYAVEGLQDDVVITPNSERIEPINDGKEIIPDETGNRLLDFQRRVSVAFIEFFDGSILQNVIIILIPVITAFGGYFVILRFTSAKSRTPSPVPEKILSYLHEHNGSSQKQIVEAVSVSRGSVSYHLKNLEKKGIIKSVRANGVSQYFLTSAAPASAEHAVILRILSRKKSGAALLYIAEQKRVNRKALADALFVNETTARWYLEQFVSCGLVVLEEIDGNVWYCITERVEEILHEMDLA